MRGERGDRDRLFSLKPRSTRFSFLCPTRAPPRSLLPAPLPLPDYTLVAFQRRAQAADADTAACTLELAPDSSIPKKIADLEARLGAVQARVGERRAALAGINRVCTASKGRLAEADAKVVALRARLVALDNDLISQTASLRGELSGAVAAAGGAWLGAETEEAQGGQEKAPQATPGGGVGASS